MNRFIVIILTGVCLAWTNPDAFAEPQSGDAKNGAAIYTRHCLRCHGANGDGQGPDAESLTIKPANFLSKSSRTQSDMSLLQTIVWGSVYSPMHGWWDQLTGQETRDVLAYIRSLAPYEPR